MSKRTTPTVAEIRAALVATNGNREQASYKLDRQHAYITQRGKRDPAVRALLNTYPPAPRGPKPGHKVTTEGHCRECGTLLTDPRVPHVDGVELCAWCLLDARRKRPQWLAQRQQHGDAHAETT